MSDLMFQTEDFKPAKPFGVMIDAGLFWDSVLDCPNLPIVRRLCLALHKANHPVLVYAVTNSHSELEHAADVSKRFRLLLAPVNTTVFNIKDLQACVSNAECIYAPKLALLFPDFVFDMAPSADKFFDALELILSGQIVYSREAWQKLIS